MIAPKAIQVRGKALGGRVPHLCTPLVGRTREAVLEEMAAIVPKRPDLLEWRVDFFRAIGERRQVLDLAAELRARAAGIPLLFTRRSTAEGGEPVSLEEPEVVGLYEAVCASGHVDLVDWELAQPADSMARVREAARRADVTLVASFHDFRATPAREVLLAKFQAAERAGAGVAKVAVMPSGPEDVLSLLSATLEARKSVAIPLIALSMGALGSLTRVAGWCFGSAATFAVGKGSSAPGQMPIEELRTALGILRRSLGELPK